MHAPHPRTLGSLAAAGSCTASLHATSQSRTVDEPIYFYSKAMPFWGLSNFSPPGFGVDGQYWLTAEHYFQAQKFSDEAIRERIRMASTPKMARAMGRSRLYTIRDGWDQLRNEVMLSALRMKFEVETAKALLLSTGSRVLVEASPFDYYWSCGRDGTGENKLGRLLMQVRAEVGC